MPWMLAIVCVVQIGSSTRTSACSTARNTFSCAWAEPVGARPKATAAAIAMQASPIGARVHNLMGYPPKFGRVQYAREAAPAQHASRRSLPAGHRVSLANVSGCAWLLTAERLPRVSRTPPGARGRLAPALVHYPSATLGAGPQPRDDAGRLPLLETARHHRPWTLTRLQTGSGQAKPSASRCQGARVIELQYFL